MSPDNIYRHAFDELSGVPCTPFNLSRIKETYKNDIDSERLFERIFNIADLLRTLEKRDCISNHVFRHLSNELDRKDIITIIDTGRIPRREAVQKPIVHTHINSNRTQQILPEVSAVPDCRVFDFLSNHLGKKWKDFARALKIGEGQIDELQATYRDRTSEIIREVLNYSKSTCDPNYWKANLYFALSKARRRDLSEHVQRLYAAYGL